MSATACVEPALTHRIHTTYGVRAWQLILSAAETDLWANRSKLCTEHTCDMMKHEFEESEARVAAPFFPINQ